MLLGPPIPSSSFLLESRARVSQSMISAEMDRKQGNKLMQINHALDTEMDDLFETLVRKRGALKAESLPLQRVCPDGKSLEPIDGGASSTTILFPADPSVGAGPAGGGCACGVCMKGLQPGQIVRLMPNCCPQHPNHALCLRAHLQREVGCPRCGQPILSSQELRELLYGIR